MKKFNKYFLIPLTTLLLGIGLGSSFLKFQKPFNKTIQNQTISYDDSINLNNLFEVWKILRSEYASPEKISREKMTDSAIKGFVEGIDDPYTVYMNKEEAKEFQENLNGELEGIGALLEVVKGNLVIVTPLKNSPAERAGLKTGDIIEKINDEITNEMSLYEAVKKIRGKKGTKVTLTIIREGLEEPFDAVIIRDEIDIESVTAEELKNNIILVSINQFSDSTMNEFQAAINQILLKKPKGMILDLRFNGGGYLDIAVAIVSEFLEGKKAAVIIKKKDEAENEVIYTTGEARLFDIPLAVLVNKGSASASEIVAGAIQDYKRGIVIGEKTFGKGSVQEISNLKDGSSLRFTVAKWLTPLGRDIDEVGISPDKEIKMPEEPKEDKDPQTDAAVNYLSL